MPKYVCSEAQHNKMWEYDVRGLTVTIQWGRIGGSLSTQTKDFSDPGSMQRFIEQKTSEKTRKGYKLVDDAELRKQESIAQAIGQQNKIQKVLWVDWNNNVGDPIEEIDDYDPAKYVYVELQNSWSKEVTRVLFSKRTSLVLDGGRELRYDKLLGDAADLADGLRRALRHLAVEVQRVVRSFGEMGRALDLDGSDEEATVKQFNVGTSASRQALSKFVALGGRALDL